MARRTAAERKAEAERMRQISEESRVNRETAEYPALLMSTLERVNNQYEMELFVRDNMFVVRSRNDHYGNEYVLSYAYTVKAQDYLQELEWKLNSIEEAQAEARRLVEVKREAERKVRELLSDEERELLGLK
jgi:ABC-type multidrug transport system fused ATPase/permease subunit